MAMMRPADDQMDVAVIFPDEGPETDVHSVGAELVGVLTGGVEADVGPGQVSEIVDILMSGVVIDVPGGTVRERLYRPPLLTAPQRRSSCQLR
ncbi:MAG: hypothetical protein M3P01_11140 [Actinomycetota bacterium]|nr:hypothetical protein [Actinomycetota bacterium]